MPELSRHVLAVGLLGSRGDGDVESTGDSDVTKALMLDIEAIQYCLRNIGKHYSPEGSVAFCNLVKRYRKFDETGLTKLLASLEAKASAPISTEGNVNPPSSRSHRPYSVR
jgi:hypothetical protein